MKRIILSAILLIASCAAVCGQSAPIFANAAATAETRVDCKVEGVN